MKRSEDAWRVWHEQARMGKTPAEIIAGLSDEALLELLAMADPHERRYELNVVLTEAKNRVHRLRMAASAPGAGDAEAGV